MRQSTFNIVHLAIALLSAVVFVTIAAAVGQANRRTTPRISHSNTQLRGIHQGLVIYANSNKNWFPGINELGENAGINVEQRYQLLIEGDFFTPEYAISPSETEGLATWDPDAGPPITSENYSFAMLQIPHHENGRRAEWAQTLNSQAIVLSDRNVKSVYQPRSIHNKKDDKSWKGNVLWNDNHVEFVSRGCVFETKYQGAGLNQADHLFLSDSPLDAYLIHSGN